MEFLYFVILGIVQGLTEFLPVSSSGHLVFVDKIFNVDSGNFLFVSIILHVATLCSVIILFRKDVLELIKHPFSKKTLLVITATIPTVIMVVVFKGFFETAFNGAYLSFCFMITAVLLMITYFISNNKKYCTKNIDYKRSLLVGIVQGFAVLPGISRSGSTIATATFSGVKSEEATSFSFIISIPIILGSLAYEIYSGVKLGHVLYNGSVFYLIISFLLALVFGIIAIKIMKRFAKTKKYYIFSIYLVILAVVSFFI